MRARLVTSLLLVFAAAAWVAPADAKRLGSLKVHRCNHGSRALCGSLSRALDPARPKGPRIRIAFRWLPASVRDSGRPALVAVEGGPGYPSIGSQVEYEGTYGPLLRTRNLLLVDNRGTGKSALINCQGLQSYTGSTSSPSFPKRVAACARRINRRHPHATDLYATSYAVADLSAVLRRLRLGRVDLYGDSYGTWFVQSFIARHPRQLHSVILDSAYPIRGLDPWYASSGEAARRAMDATCARDLACRTAAPGSATARLAKLLALVRDAPLAGETRGAAGGKVHAVVDARALVDMVQDAGSDPVIYRELDASVRAALAGDSAPLLRLVAQSQEWSHSPNDAGYFSDGLYFAVACTDYPQLFDMRSSPAARRGQFATAAGNAPDAFRPFTPAEWVLMSAYSEPYQACLDWPRPAHSAPPLPAKVRPLPASVPILVIGGDLDSLTPLADAQVFAPTLGETVRVLTLPNTVHVTSEGDTYLYVGATCARRIIRSFVSAPNRLGQLDTGCTEEIPPVHTPGAYPVRLADARPASVLSGPNPGGVARRATTVAAGALGDAGIRFYYSGETHGPGLRGGTFSSAPIARGVRFRLKGVRFVSDATVDGTGTWETEGTGRFHGDMVVRSAERDPVHVIVDWNQNASAALATVGGTTLTLPAP